MTKTLNKYKDKIMNFEGFISELRNDTIDTVF